MKPKIFITTGSSLEFDSLIQIMDKINKNNKYDVLAQIGKGKIRPKNIKTFKFTKNISKYYSWADLIITHTGGTTLSEICEQNKKAISISNPLGYNGIYEIAKKFDEQSYLKYLDFNEIKQNPKQLENLIDNVLNNKYKFNRYKKTGQTIGKEIIRFLNSW